MTQDVVARTFRNANQDLVLRGRLIALSARTALSASAGSAIDIGSVIDRDYLDESLAFVNSVDHPIRAASRTPKAFKLQPEGFSHPLRRICDMLDRL